MSHDPGPIPAVFTSCAYCQARFATPVPIVGEPENARFVKLCQTLADHLNRKHREVAQQCLAEQVNQSICYSTMVVLAHFNSADDDLAKFRDQCRGSMHAYTKKVHVSDATIEEKLSVFALPPDKHAAVSELFRQMRDIIEEIPPLSADDITRANGKPASGLILAS